MSAAGVTASARPPPSHARRPPFCGQRREQLALKDGGGGSDASLASDSGTRSKSMNKLSAIDVKLEDILKERDARAKFAQFLARYLAERNAPHPPESRALTLPQGEIASRGVPQRVQ